ncbi:hypothetical protein K1719_023469 [Acacia pycnantha]|nr:hypothetical protein K1719_023469 [Acacia pycnantha]
MNEVGRLKNASGQIAWAAAVVWLYGEEAKENLGKERWRPEFNPKSALIESVVAWVRFSDLPAPLFDKKFLLNLGNVIGKAIKLDIHTAQRARGKFARMCVELDLTKPLVLEFEIEGQVLSIVYESLGMLCNKCGRFGHLREIYEEFHKTNMDEKMDVQDLGRQQTDAEDKVVPRELWKTMQRPRRPRRNPLPTQHQQSGSRFTVLEGELDEEGGMKRGEGAHEGYALANFSYSLEEVRVSFGTPPDVVRSFLFQDEVGVAYPRSVVMQD